ncbi:hypothetical protein AB2M62_03525 [Sphingomonas sp. MMS12-HWE2-04]|uniref:hypothetical protein n=1 Tax=Sphingomonas sp. MMS12-HWE2-04 TaxID=3234199 RepID=UPI00384CA46C
MFMIGKQASSVSAACGAKNLHRLPQIPVNGVRTNSELESDLVSVVKLRDRSEAVTMARLKAAVCVIVHYGTMRRFVSSFNASIFLLRLIARIMSDRKTLRSSGSYATLLAATS